MDSNRADSKTTAPLWAAFVAAALTAAAAWFSYTVQPVWWLAWVAPIPVFAYAVRAGRLAAFIVGAVGCFIGVMSWWPFLHDRLNAPAIAIVGAVVPAALAFGIACLVLRTFARRGFVAAAPFATAAFWTAFSWLGSVTSINGSGGNIGYSQMDFLPAIQIAALGGVHAIGFLLILFAASVAVLFAPVAEIVRRNAAVVGLGVVMLALLAGTWRVNDTVEPSLKVAALAIDDPGPKLVPKATTPEGEALLARYVDAVAATARQGAKIVLIPENVVTIEDGDEAAFETRFREAAKANAVDIVVGAGRYTAGPNWNLAYVFKADGGEAQKYTKRHLVPGFERQFTPGEGEPFVSDAASGRWGVSICKDLDFPEYQRTYGAAGVGLLVVPAWDFVQDAWLHNRTAVLRGVENGFAMLRTARNGLLTVTDDRGRVLASVASASAPVASLVANAPTTYRPTLYTRIGDTFSYVAMAAFLLLLAWLFVDGRKRV